MLTPIDIQKQEFDVKFRGYNADEVDNFLDLVGTDYEKLYKENIELKQQLKTFSKEIENYRAMENSLKESIVLAQTAADDVKKNANDKAANIIEVANNEAKDILKGVELQLAEKKQELENIKMEIGKYQANVKGICSGILEFLEKIE